MNHCSRKEYGTQNERNRMEKKGNIYNTGKIFIALYWLLWKRKFFRELHFVLDTDVNGVCEDRTHSTGTKSERIECDVFPFFSFCQWRGGRLKRQNKRIVFLWIEVLYMCGRSQAGWWWRRRWQQQRYQVVSWNIIMIISAHKSYLMDFRCWVNDQTVDCSRNRGMATERIHLL